MRPKTSKQSSNPDVVVVKTRRKLSKSFDVVDFITRPVTFITIGVAIIACAGLAIYLVDRANNDKPVSKSTKSQQQIVSEAMIKEKKENSSKPLAKDASADEAKRYYSDALWLKVNAGDNAKISDYYIKTIVVNNIQLDLDLSEAVVRALVSEGHDAEAKPLIGFILKTYKSSPPSGDPAVRQYIDERIQTYTKLEETL